MGNNDEEEEPDNRLSDVACGMTDENKKHVLVFCNDGLRMLFVPTSSDKQEFTSSYGHASDLKKDYTISSDSDGFYEYMDDENDVDSKIIYRFLKWDIDYQKFTKLINSVFEKSKIRKICFIAFIKSIDKEDVVYDGDVKYKPRGLLKICGIERYEEMQKVLMARAPEVYKNWNLINKPKILSSNKWKTYLANILYFNEMTKSLEDYNDICNIMLSESADFTEEKRFKYMRYYEKLLKKVNRWGMKNHLTVII